MSVFWQGLVAVLLAALGIICLYGAAVFTLSVLYHLAGIR